MTRGPLLKELIFFTIPLVLGTLLQLTYNAADSMIVGRFVGKTALAAVGTTNPLVTLVLLFTNGICLGAGILVGTLYGARKTDELRRQVSTGMIAGCAFSVGVAALMMIFARPLLVLLQVEHSIIAEGTTYLRIILLGLVFSFVYNYLASMLRAMGDSASPLIFLGMSAGLNIAGDLFFVVVLGMGIGGAAVSTVLCEALSAAACLLYIRAKIPELRLGRGWLVFDASLLKKTVSYGFVSAMQQSTVQLGKLGTQTIVNTLGVDATAAFNATNRFDDFNEGRVRGAFRLGMYIELVYGVAIGFITYFAAGPLMHLFSTDPEVLREGTRYLRLIAFMYPLPAITNGIQGYFRGTGDLKVTLYSSIINMGVRVASEVPMILFWDMGFLAVPWSYTLGWIAMTAFETPFLIKRLRKTAKTLQN